MKNLFKKMNVSVVAILLGFGLIALHSAFTPAKEKRASVYWRFDSNSLLDARSGTQYTLIADPEAPACDDTPVMPCVIEVDESIDTQTELNTYLQATYSTPEQVRDASLFKKSGE